MPLDAELVKQLGHLELEVEVRRDLRFVAYDPGDPLAVVLCYLEAERIENDLVQTSIDEVVKARCLPGGIHPVPACDEERFEPEHLQVRPCLRLDPDRVRGLVVLATRTKGIA